MKRLQIFIHQHYEGIKLTLIFLVFLMVGYTVLGYSIDRIERPRRENEIIMRVMQEFDKKLDDQTNKLEDNFDATNSALRAVCLLIIEMSGKEMLEQLDEDTRQRCDQLSSPPINSANSQPNIQNDSTGFINPTQPTTPQAAPTPQPSREPVRQPETVQPDPQPNPSEPENRNLLDIILPPITNLLGG